MKIDVTGDVRKDMSIPVGDVHLNGELIIPNGAKELILFSHGSGSSRFSPRNNKMAKYFREKGMGTLLFDLLTSKEDAVYANRFDIKLLTKRLVTVTGWIMGQNDNESFHLGYFGASTGAASAINAAAELSNTIKAVVCRGGRTDLSAAFLDRLKAPTLLIVGELDKDVLELNRKTYEKLTCPKDLKIVPGATHLFEEEGALEQVASLSSSWFEKYLFEK